MRVVAFTGLPGSGKSEAVRIAREHGLPVVRMGDFVLEEVRRRGLPLEETHIGPVASGMRKQHGDDVWARRTIEAIQVGGNTLGADEPLVVVDGVRSLAEVNRFRRDLGREFILVGVSAPDAIRHARLLNRGRNDDVRDVNEALVRDARERGWGVESAIEEADHVLANDTDLAGFRAKAHALLMAIMRKGANPGVRT